RDPGASCAPGSRRLCAVRSNFTESTSRSGVLVFDLLELGDLARIVCALLRLLRLELLGDGLLEGDLGRLGGLLLGLADALLVLLLRRLGGTALRGGLLIGLRRLGGLLLLGFLLSLLRAFLRTLPRLLDLLLAVAPCSFLFGFGALTRPAEFGVRRALLGRGLGVELLRALHRFGAFGGECPARRDLLIVEHAADDAVQHAQSPLVHQARRGVGGQEPQLLLEQSQRKTGDLVLQSQN